MLLNREKRELLGDSLALVVWRAGDTDGLPAYRETAEEDTYGMDAYLHLMFNSFLRCLHLWYLSLKGICAAGSGSTTVDSECNNNKVKVRYGFSKVPRKPTGISPMRVSGDRAARARPGQGAVAFESSIIAFITKAPYLLPLTY